MFMRFNFRLILSRNWKKWADKTTVETESKSKLEDIRKAVESCGLTAETAMNSLKISSELQKELRPLIFSKNFFNLL